MPLVLPNQGLPYLLDWLTRRPGGDELPWRLHLFVNDEDPVPESVFSEFEVATFGGYSPEELARENWEAATLDGDRAVTTYTTTPITWTLVTGPQTVYGYLITDIFDAVLLVAERFETPVEVAIGGVIGVLPRIEFGTCPE